jgi:effector-binding domain-containing protein
VPDYDVRIATVQSVPIAAVRSRTTRADLPKAIRSGLDQVWPQIKMRPGLSRGLNVVMYHPSQPDGLGPEFEIETGVQVPGDYVPADPVYLTLTPAGRVVTTAHMGLYDRLADAYRAIDAYVRRERIRLAGPSWEVYGHWHEDPAKLRTDVFFPIT